MCPRYMLKLPNNRFHPGEVLHAQNKTGTLGKRQQDLVGESEVAKGSSAAALAVKRKRL